MEVVNLYQHLMQENLELGNTQEKHNGNKKERFKPLFLILKLFIENNNCFLYIILNNYNEQNNYI